MLDIFRNLLQINVSVTNYGNLSGNYIKSLFDIGHMSFVLLKITEQQPHKNDIVTSMFSNLNFLVKMLMH